MGGDEAIFGQQERRKIEEERNKEDRREDELSVEVFEAALLM